MESIVLMRISFQLLVPDNKSPWTEYGGCELRGIDLSGGRHLRNLGTTRVLSGPGSNARGDDKLT